MVGTAFDDESERFTYAYNNSGQVGRLDDAALARFILSEYDLANRPARKRIYESSGTHVYTAQVSYDKYNKH